MKNYLILRPNHKLVAVFVALMLINSSTALPTRAQTDPPAKPQPPGLITTDINPPASTPSDSLSENAAQPEFADGPAEAHVQGAVTLDVVVPDTLTAGGLITYTFKYKNESSAPASGIVLDTSYANYGSISSTDWQVCEPVNCPPQLPFGPVVTKVTSGTLGVNARYLIETLSPGQSGEFSVVLRTFTSLYPKTGKPVIRPAASGRLYVNNNVASLVSDDTANTMFVGPVFYLTKKAVSTDPIYVGDFVEFILRVGNATGPGDSITGTLRADARTATNIVLEDKIPLGTVFESATDTPLVDNATRMVTWHIPGPLAPGQFVERHVVFRKQDIYSTSDCTRVQNLTYSATSDEYPLINNSIRPQVNGQSVSVPVIPQIQVKSITASPTTVYFGDQASISLLVQNFYTHSLSGVQLRYTVQPNMRYVPGSAQPPPDSAPTPGLYGGDLVWTFNMAAGSMTAPSSQVVTLTMQAGNDVTTDASSARIILAGDLPLSCSRKDYRVQVDPRITVDKMIDPVTADDWPLLSGESLVDRGAAFSYLIRLHNRSGSDANGVTVMDNLPSSLPYPADFRYVADSSTINMVPRPPDSVVDGNTGNLTWSNLSLPAGGTLEIRYRLTVNGTDYVSYCNTVSVNLGGEAPDYGSKRVCVKINPRLRMTLLADKDYAQPGEQVVFTITLSNEEGSVYKLGLANALNEFVWGGVQQSGYATPTLINVPKFGPVLTWPLVDLAPGNTLSSTFVTHMPNPCARRAYVDEGLFLIDSGTGGPALIRWIPPVKETVTCGTLEYSKTASRPVIGLRDRITYTLSVHNSNGDAVAQNVIITDVLPPNLTYVGLDLASQITTQPVQSIRPDGRRQLVWKLNTLDKLATANIKFIAQSGDAVGAIENWLIASASNSPGGRCTSITCKAVEEDGQVAMYAAVDGEVQSLITMAPELTETACARPGDLRAYRLTVLNTNDRAYSQIGVTVKVPLGLRYVRALSQTIEPRVETDALGATLLKWDGLQVTAKPPSTFAAQIGLMVELQVGNALGDLEIEAAASNPNTIIPRKDDVNNPIVGVCLPSVPTLTKEVSRQRVRFDSELVYQISVANPTSATFLTSFEDVLPGEFDYQGALSGPAPTADGNTLTWNELGVPANSVVQLKFVVRARGARGATYVNTVQLLGENNVIEDIANASAQTYIEDTIYLPSLAR